MNYKKLLFLLILSFLFIPKNIFALETREYHVCKNGCDYSSLEEVFTLMSQVTSNAGMDVNIYIDDSDTYDLPTHNYIYNRKSVWESGRLKSRFYNVLIKGNDSSRAKVTSSALRQDFNYSERGLFIDVWEGLTIENIEFNVGGNSILFNAGNGNVTLNNVLVRASTFYTYYTTDNTIINDSEFYCNVSLDDSDIKNTNIYGNYEIYNALGKLRNVNIDGNVNVIGALDFKDVVINASGDVGVGFHYYDCGCDCSYEEFSYDSHFDNVTVKGAKTALYYEKGVVSGNSKFYIDNSDLSDSELSVHMNNKYTCTYNTTYDEYSVIGTNSKLSGAYTSATNSEEEYSPEFGGSDPNNFKALNMYFDATNKWNDGVKRFNNYNSINLKYSPIVEENKGNIVVEQENKALLSLKATGGENLNQLFTEVTETLKDSDWVIKDESICYIKDGKIVPLKIGETTISARVNNDVYTIKVTVTDKDLSNPKTYKNILSLLSIFFIVSGTGLILINRKKRV